MGLPFHSLTLIRLLFRFIVPHCRVSVSMQSMFCKELVSRKISIKVKVKWKLGVRKKQPKFVPSSSFFFFLRRGALRRFYFCWPGTTGLGGSVEGGRMSSSARFPVHASLGDTATPSYLLLPPHQNFDGPSSALSAPIAIPTTRRSPKSTKCAINSKIEEKNKWRSVTVTENPAKSEERTRQ